MISIIFFGVIITTLLLLPLSIRLNLALWTSVLQIYTLPLFGFYPSIALLSAYSLIKNMLKTKQALLHPPILSLIALIVIQLISISWSPDKKLGFATIVYEVPFILIYIASYSLDPRQMFFAFRGYAYLSLIPAIFTFIFFFHHDLNLRYITSPLAKLFINPNSIKLYLSDTSHYLWNGKPITLNLNPNVTAGLLGIIAILAWGLAYLFQYKPFKYIATFLWFSVFLAGSTAASLLNILIPIAGLWYYFCQHLRHPKWINRTSILISIVSILTGLLITTYTHPALHHFILNKLLSRILLWKVTGTFASTHWLTGIGFGGWDSYYSDFIKNAASKHYQAGLPPHNSIIQLFSESGIFALMFAILFIILLIKNIFSYIRQVNKSEKIFGICLLAAFAWMFIQGLGENWRLLGDIRVQPLLATCYGMMMARLKSNQGKF